MTTQIFRTKADFFEREDKTINGVSPEFAEMHPDYEKQNATNKGCWDCSYCSYCSRCSDCSDCSDCWHCSRCSRCWDCSYCSYCSRCSDCSDCSDCWHCSRCSRCSDCSDCSYCSYCSDCSYCSYCSYCDDMENSDDNVKPPKVPVVENLDKAVYLAASQPDSLEMGNWHSCENTHCRAGWIVTLAGDQGKKLESFFNTELAAMLIYQKSTGRKINPSRFYDSNEAALADMKRLAEGT